MVKRILSKNIQFGSQTIKAWILNKFRFNKT